MPAFHAAFGELTEKNTPPHCSHPILSLSSSSFHHNVIHRKQISKYTTNTVTAQLLCPAHSKHSTCCHYLCFNYLPFLQLIIIRRSSSYDGKFQGNESFLFLYNKCNVCHYLLLALSSSPSTYCMLQIPFFSSPSSLILWLVVL